MEIFMYILAIETTGAHASAAVINKYGNVKEEISQGTMNHLQNLIPMIEKLLSSSGIDKSELTAIAASAGPGSFTCIRIGVATARALAQALDIPAIAVPTLEAFAYNAKESQSIICPIFDARRNQIYGGAYIWKENRIVEIVKGAAYDLPDYLSELEKAMKCYEEVLPELTFYGDGIAAYGEKIKEWQASSPIDDIRLGFAEGDMSCQRASSVAQLALEIYKNGGQISFEELMPDYMRKAEAERKL